MLFLKEHDFILKKNKIKIRKESNTVYINSTVSCWETEQLCNRQLEIFYFDLYKTISSLKHLLIEEAWKAEGV